MMTDGDRDDNDDDMDIDDDDRDDDDDDRDDDCLTGESLWPWTAAEEGRESNGNIICVMFDNKSEQRGYNWNCPP